MSKKNSNENTIGHILQYNRKARNLTIKQLEKSSGVSASFISRIENNLANPSIEIMTKLATAMDMPVSDFFQDQKAGKVLLPLKISHARCLQDPMMYNFLESIKDLNVEERHSVLSLAILMKSWLSSVLEPTQLNSVYKINPQMFPLEQLQDIVQTPDGEG